jgi:hypothetical protein
MIASCGCPQRSDGIPSEPRCHDLRIPWPPSSHPVSGPTAFRPAGVSKAGQPGVELSFLTSSHRAKKGRRTLRPAAAGFKNLWL